MKQLDGKVAVVTGGGSGIGNAVVRRFVDEGARVVVLDRSAAGCEEVADVCGDAVAVVVGDVRNVADNRAAVAAARSRFGRLDVLVANAGIYDNRLPFADATLEELDAGFDELFSVDVKGYLLGARAALDDLRASRGCIVFTASVSGVAAGYGGVLYVAAKHAVVGLTRQLALECAPEVRVNAVAAGYAPTSLQGLEALGQSRSTVPFDARHLPLGVVASPDDYAAWYVLLAGDAGSRTATGTVVVVDGGSSVAGPSFRAATS